MICHTKQNRNKGEIIWVLFMILILDLPDLKYKVTVMLYSWYMVSDIFVCKVGFSLLRMTVERLTCLGTGQDWQLAKPDGNAAEERDCSWHSKMICLLCYVELNEYVCSHICLSMHYNVEIVVFVVILW